MAAWVGTTGRPKRACDQDSDATCSEAQVSTTSSAMTVSSFTASDMAHGERQRFIPLHNAGLRLRLHQSLPLCLSASTHTRARS